MFRDYVLLELDDSSLKEVERRHDLFRDKVGSHLDFDESGRRLGSDALVSKEHWEEFYKEARTWPDLDLSNSSAVGWFEDAIGSANEE